MAVSTLVRQVLVEPILHPETGEVLGLLELVNKQPSAAGDTFTYADMQLARGVALTLAFFLQRAAEAED